MSEAGKYVFVESTGRQTSPTRSRSEASLSFPLAHGPNTAFSAKSTWRLQPSSTGEMPEEETTVAPTPNPDEGFPEAREDFYNDPLFKMPRWDVQEDIVISGISGRFPESDNIEELKYNLYEGVDMITENDRRWKPGLLGTPKRMGKLKDIEHFDSDFFGYNKREAEMMDPMQRMMLESVYECIFDAGYNPESLRGKKIGVFIGCSEKSVWGDDFCPVEMLTGEELLGTRTSFMSNRVSYKYGFKGPSFNVDTACSSTIHALNEAFLALKSNRCDAAIVGGGTISLSVNMTVSFARLGLISKEGTCKVFDATANGYVRSEAVGAVFIQRASDARRCYSTILHSKLNNDGAKQEGISFPSAKQQKNLFREVYCEMGYNPSEIDYLEAHGTGTVAGDREESNAIAEYFLPGRTTPLLIGSVKSNLGHAEAASGTCTLAKLILAMEESVIPPNLHYKEANPHVPALVNGKMKVIAEKTPWVPGIVAVNNFGFGGSNAHFVLKAHQAHEPSKPKAFDRKIPRLVLISGRTEAAVQHIFQKIKEDEFTDEALVLLEEACRAPTSGMKYRGYGLVQEPGQDIPHVIKVSPADHRPVWFLFPGLEIHWSQVGRELMKLEVFAKSIEKAAKIMQPFGVDLLGVIKSPSTEAQQNIVAELVTTTAIQIALVDVMKALRVVPEGVLGHSAGELVCAYVDGCFTAEQTLLAAFYRAVSLSQSKIVKGAMAEIGASWDRVKKFCSDDVFPACHNSENSVTISGPETSIKTVVAKLNDANISARLIQTCNFALHTKHMAPATQVMKKELDKIITKPLPRSSRWISTSVPEDLNRPNGVLSSADYHVNNLLSPVFFKEAMSKVPKNATVIQFAPQSHLRDIVQGILGEELNYVELIKKPGDGVLTSFLNAVGELYTCNLTPEAKNLYDEIKFPVTRGTAMLSSLIKWNHEDRVNTWSQHKFHEQRDNISVDTTDGGTYSYLRDYQMGGQMLFPVMGFVELAWKALAKYLQAEVDETPVIIEDINIYKICTPDNSGKYIFKMKGFDGIGNFRYEEGGDLVASGRIKTTEENVLRMKDAYMEVAPSSDSFTLDASDFYKELALRGYEYGPTFQSVENANSQGLSGQIKWNNNWMSFLESMLQIVWLSMPHRSLVQPIRIKSIRIDPKLLPKENEESVQFTFNPKINVCRSGPVEIQGLYCNIVFQNENPKAPVLEEHVFVPYFESSQLPAEEKVCLREYDSVCATLANRLSKHCGKNGKAVFQSISNFKDAPEKLIQKYLQMDCQNYSLLKILRDALGGVSENGSQDSIKRIMLAREDDILEDALSTVSLKEPYLRAALDIVLGNRFSNNLKVLEVGEQNLCHKAVKKIINLSTLGLVHLDYTFSKVIQNLQTNNKTQSCNMNSVGVPVDNDLVISKDMFTHSMRSPLECLKSLAASVKETGFVILLERTSFSPAEKLVSVITGKEQYPVNSSNLEKYFAQAGLTMVARKSDDLSCVVYLLRKLPEKTTATTSNDIIHLSNDFSWVESLKKKLKENAEKENHPIWLVSEQPCSGILGLINCLRLEPGGRNLRCIFTASLGDNKSMLKFQKDDPVFKDIFRKDLVFNVFRDGQWGMLQHRSLSSDPETLPVKNSGLLIHEPGNLSSLRWTEMRQASSETSGTKTGHVRIQNYYAALNTSDVMLATKKLPVSSDEKNFKEYSLGMEFVGRDAAGRRVMGFVPWRGLATSTLVPSTNVIPVPDHWSMEEACTVPVAYMTAYYALINRAGLRNEQSVLIHSGASDVGLAAISIALSMSCDVYVTVGSDEEKKYLRETFPEIKENHITSSRDANFEFHIMNITCGQGVDVVLNSLCGEMLQASLRCIRTNGTFLELGKVDMSENKDLRMSIFLRNMAFHGVTMDGLIAGRDQELLEELKDLLNKGVVTGVVKPLKRQIFGTEQVQDAFKLMAGGKNTGKVVIKIREEEPRGKPVNDTLRIPSVARTYCHPDKSYIVTGAVNGFAFELVGWLVERGAKHVVLSCRSELKEDYQRVWVQRWNKMGVDPVIDQSDISTASGAKQLLTKAQAKAPVGGIFHLDTVLRNHFLENMRSEFFQEVCVPKVLAVSQLDALSRQICPQLDYFVVFSSAACGKGNAAQSNTAYASSVMERVAELRRKQGLPGLAIQWGDIEGVSDSDHSVRGTGMQSVVSCLDILDRAMQGKRPVISSFVPADICN